MTKPRLVFAVLLLCAVATIAFAFYFRVMAGVFLHDSNLETFQQSLNDEQRHGIMLSVKSITSCYAWLLIITNILWFLGAWFLLSKLKASLSKSA